MLKRLTLLLPILLLLPACSHAKKPTNGFLSGKATVLDINQTLGICTLKIDDRSVPAYWQTETEIAQEGTISGGGPLGGAVGTYKEPYVRRQNLPVKPGDTILFRGVLTDNELYLRAVQVVQN